MANSMCGPVYVLDTVGTIQNCGQTCSAASRILVERPVFDEVRRRMAERYAALLRLPVAVVRKTRLTGSTVHADEHPSPSITLPSSHASPGPTKPSPQNASRQSTQASVSTVFASSHFSRPSTTALPQVESWHALLQLSSLSLLPSTPLTRP